MKQGNTILFCGAGISFDSGLPIVGSFLNYLFQQINLTQEQATLISSSELPFESIIQTLEDETRIDALMEIFDQGEPNANHSFIAKLVKQGYVKVICTTNFDVLIEKALINEKLYPENDFKVYRTAKDLEAIDWETDEVKLIKIHGCVSRKLEMAMTMRQVAGKQYVVSRARVIQALFSGKRFPSALILGYSCSDAFDINPFIEAVPENLMNLALVEHQNTVTERVEDIRIKEFKNPFRKFSNGKRIFADTANVVRQLWGELFDCKYESIPRKEVDWQNKVDEWIEKANHEGPKEIGYHIVARLFYDIGKFDESVLFNKKAIAVAAKYKDVKAKGAALGNLASAYNAKGQYNKATTAFKESIAMCRKSRNVPGLISQLQGYGILLNRIRKNEEAIRVHQEALYYALKEGDENGISNTLGNLANAYNALHRPDEAIVCIEKALPISEKIGNKQSESSQIALMATALMLKGDFEESLKHNLKSLQIKRMIGDKFGICALLLNIANTLANLNRGNDATKFNDECLMIAKEIGNRELEMKAMLNEAIIG